MGINPLHASIAVALNELSIAMYFLLYHVFFSFAVFKALQIGRTQD